MTATKSSILKNHSHLLKDSMEALHGVRETPQRKLVPSRRSSSTSETISRTSTGLKELRQGPLEPV